MEFEFDPGKSASNKDKHGIDFIEAQTLWLDDGSITIPAKSMGETRSALIAKLGDKLWVAFYTERNDAIRIISVRRAREMERQHYEDHHSRRT
ncbi:BrnT family toxin [Neorhizobium galegae]|uniref:BrnT family toxin n=1 Tax=Neorhizobium galegae TaxID=399 RepID=UPI0021075AFC|nr:BrnT family toxin [Neorhizobium galegae]MCQ1836100.1 BrnT family toxin [Neorhizobium galegae]UIY28403.1 BrnT family toxin [Neorhizobium galegae]